MLLEIEGLHVHYGKVPAINDLTIHVDTGELVALIGANGAGKTTTLKTISGIRPVSQGVIKFDGADITGVQPHKLVELGISQAPEGRGIFPGMSVVENLEMGAFTRKVRRSGLAEEFARVFDLFPVLAERRSQSGGTLSGGEQQMLAIGRALMSKPRLLLLDEPSMGLAPIRIRQIFTILKTIREQGTTVLLVEQNAVQALEHSDRAYVIECGSIVKTGSGADLMQDDSIKKAYLGGS